MAGPYDISAIMAEMERALIESQKRALSSHMAMVKKRGSSITQWQALKIAGLKNVRIQNGKIVTQYNTQATRAIQDILAGDFNKATQAAVDKFGAAGALTQVPDAWNRNFFGVNEPKLAALVDATAGEVKAASASALRYMDDQYRQTV